MDFSSWDDPAIPTDETFGTFMTVAHSFFVHAEDSGLGYRVPLKRMMNLLQEFGERDRERYSQYSNTPAAETFRATLMVAALSYGFGEDLRTEFRGLRFPINDEVYNELIQRAGTTRMSRSTTTTGTDVAQSSTRTLEAEWGTYYAMPFVVIGAVVAVIVIVAALLLTRRRRKNQRWLPK
jgi:hypothetical protein